MNKLVVDQLTKSFDSSIILQNVSFSIQDGEFVSILGPSGSGKSTLFHLIGGLYRPDSGEIYINGERTTGEKGRISYMPQSPSLLPWRTILENVVLSSEIIEQPNKSEALNMIQQAGLEGYEHAYPAQLSGGMKQRASFIRSLLSPQSLICLDEPFSALDEFTRMDMQEWLLSIWTEHRRSILFVTHNIEEAIFLSDRVIVLSDRPAKVQREFTIPFARPRHSSLMLTREFLKWKKEIFEELKVLV
ncbi:ABC-type nitrate/sulfonate/bicarbonate transport system, ATPase component [Halobacillus alkaliphilus]|uniref:ABC-type nitrate/sulfonate/bicarbonate transport system, ATPase component n=1 Tax=Halobacillus alkaliphilus TaxID=396056 RepID=A0A1I2QF59_9BACI|nr:ABC transporter ATP-binding protein [Halobacillus alkaliphilus]SFG24887.1 ABC-type nitrate/sulfonate/bicarbonate transport system, ATPase component [Halobacillus alkaliphilus]